MFTTNSKMTGWKFTYDGNPHSFGSRHPSYVNYGGEKSVHCISSQVCSLVRIGSYVRYFIYIVICGSRIAVKIAHVQSLPFLLISNLTLAK